VDPTVMRLQTRCCQSAIVIPEKNILKYCVGIVLVNKINKQTLARKFSGRRFSFIVVMRTSFP
jgi:hypothetical protein